MAKRLQVPKELQHLIEKRETGERRKTQRRVTEPGTKSTVDRKSEEAANTAAPKRRKQVDRRESGRRKSDQK